MQPLTGPVAVAAALLAAGGAPKAFRPATTVGALRSVGLRVPAPVVRAGGVAEALLGLGTLAFGGRVAAALVAASYAAFTAFVAVALRRGGAVSSCGCIGREDTPPTVAHVALTAGLAALAAAAAVAWPPAGLPAAVGADVGDGLALLVFTGLGAWLAWLVLAALPRLRPPPQPAAGGVR